MSDINSDNDAESALSSAYSPSPPPSAATVESSSPQSRKRKRPTAATTTTVTITQKRTITKTTVKAAKKEEPDSDSEPETKKAKKPTKSKAPTQKQLEKEMLAKNPHLLKAAVRTATKTHFIGAHVSAAGGVHNALTAASQIGANSLALFLKSQRKWTSPDLAPAAITSFIKLSKSLPYDPTTQILPHGSYLINLAQPDPEKHKTAYDCFLDDLKRCEKLKIGLYNFHPGSTLGEPRQEAIARIAGALNKAHKETRSVVTVLENMAGAGNVIGARWEDLRDVIELIEDKTRVGVCIDTCHMFASGYDMRDSTSYAKTMEEFDAIVGRKYLRAFHLNDSKAPLGSKKDLHANIGMGWIGLEGFRCLMNDDRTHGVPMVLETPLGKEDEKVMGRWREEVKLLEWLVGKEAGDEELLEKSEVLQEMGRKERERVEEVVERKGREKKEKEEKAAARAAKKVEKLGRKGWGSYPTSTEETLQMWDEDEERLKQREEKAIHEVGGTLVRKRRVKKEVVEEENEESACESCSEKA